MKITLIAATYKRPDVCNRLILSVPRWINIVIVCLSGKDGIEPTDNVHLHESEQMPLTNALNLGASIADKVFPETDAYLLTDDDVYFTKDTIIGENIFSLLRRADTGIVAITRIINKINVENVHLESYFVYKGGGYLIRKNVFHKIGGYTENNSVDEWDICIKLYIAGYRNYRTKSAYAYHKQGSASGGYKQAVKEGSDIGRADNWFMSFLEYRVMRNSGYEYISHSSVKLKDVAKNMHEFNNKKINR